MRERKNTLLLFSKLPEVGLVKTRLSVLKDGMFPPETAAYLYHCMLFDVVEIASAALSDLQNQQLTGFEGARSGVGQAGECGQADATRQTDTAGSVGTTGPAGAAGSAGECGRSNGEEIYDSYELVISTTPASNVALMQKLFDDAGTWPWPIKFIADEGVSFDEHYNHAFKQCWDAGSSCILSMGADMPALTKRDIFFGFEQLHRLETAPQGGIVLAPDQEMGVSVVGWTRNTHFDHTGVYYCTDGLTVLPAYIKKAERQGLPVLYLPPVPDVDTMADFMHNVTLVHSLCYCAQYDDVCAPWRCAEAFTDLGFKEIIVAPNDLRDPREHIDK